VSRWAVSTRTSPVQSTDTAIELSDCDGRVYVVDVSGLDNQVALVERIQDQVNSALMEYCASAYTDVHDKFGQLLVLLNELRLVSLSAEEFLYASGTISDNTLLMEMLHSRQT